MKIYNTLTRKKEEFVPIEEGKVKMYVCGPTVYNYFHIGNARPFVVFDTMRKYLEYRGYKVKFVQNFTDVDDKIINRAKEEGISATEVSEKYIEEYYKDAAALNVKKATVHPQVSKTIEDIIRFVQDLIDKGYAYEADGDVYYSTRKFKDYGKLSGQNIDDLESGARIAIGEVKKDPLDFALWKAQKEPDEINDFRNVFGHLRVHVRRNHVQRLRIFEVFFYVLLGYLRSGDFLFLGPANNLVIHVSEILHELHIISSVFEIPAQCIEHHERSGISNVKEIVYGRSADVNPNLPLFQRYEFFLAAGHGIVYLHRFPFPRQISPAVPIRLKTISGSLHHPIQNPVH